jgi:hypothetical protein
MRLRTIAMLMLGLAMAVPTLALPASAQEADGTSTTQGPGSDRVGIGDGIFLTGAVITPPGDEAPRTLDAYDAAVLVQSWMPAAYWGGTGLIAEPPPDLPVYRIDTRGEWGNPNAVGGVTVYFATDGTTAYVAFPGLVVWKDASGAPPPSGWFTPPARVIDAFNGEAELEDSTGTQMATTPSMEPSDESAAGDTDEATSEWPWATIASVAVLGGGLGFLLRRSRRSRSSTDPA